MSFAVSVGLQGPETGFARYDGGIWMGNRVFVAGSCSLENVVYQLHSLKNGINAVPAIYADAAGALGALLATGAQVNDAVAGLNTLPLTAPLAVGAGTWIWVGLFQANVGNIDSSYQTAAPSSKYFVGVPPAPDPGHALSVLGWPAIIYATGESVTPYSFAEGSQYGTLSVVQVAAHEARAITAGALVVGNFPAEQGRASQAAVMTTVDFDMQARASQMQTMVVARGRTTNPTLKVSFFSLDNHEFYQLRLGINSTLIYDLATKRWSNWGTGNISRWRLVHLINWPGALKASPGSMVVGGDDTLGVLYFLDPDYPYDDDPFLGGAEPQPFLRIVQGQVVHRGDDPVSCYGVDLTGSFGDVFDASMTAVNLSYSDDAGKSYIDAGTQNIPQGEYAARVEWDSLGMIKSPGRLFKIQDHGALQRVDSLDMENED